MQKDEKYLARIMFKNKILDKMGNEFQSLFWDIMSCAYSDFQKVKPHGNRGDSKNDGYHTSNGTYYQVYAPAELRINEAKAISKLKQDFEGLKVFWDSHLKINKFCYVLNDKYKGISPNLNTCLLDLAKENPDIEFKFFLAKELEDEFMSLSEDNMTAIIGLIPAPEKIETIDFSILTEIINYILEKQKPSNLHENLNSTEFIEKIKFNNLNTNISNLLRVANFQAGALDEFFSLNSNYTKKELRDIFVEYYEEGKEKIEDCDIKNDLVFSHILDKTCTELIESRPDQAKYIQDAALVLISYYFESCDIFEIPPEEGEINALA